MKPQRISLARLASWDDRAALVRLAGGAALASSILLAGCSGSLEQDPEGSDDPNASPPSVENLPPGTTINADGTVVNADGTPVLNPDGTPVTVGVPGSPSEGMPTLGPDGTPIGEGTNPDGKPPAIDETPPPPECEPGVPGTSQLPRLTKVQYDNTIRDLVGLETGPSALLAPDTTGSVDQRAWDGYQAAAEAVAAQIMADPDARARAIPCTPSGDGAECARQFVTEFGARAFRRPLTDAEVTKFTGLFERAAEITETGSFDEVAEVVLRAFLVSPSFLTRAEISESAEAGVVLLNGYEVATRLSYLLWASMPDRGRRTQDLSSGKRSGLRRVRGAIDLR